MPDFRVRWEMDIFDAEDARDAAQKALEIQRNPESIATVFEVEVDGRTTTVDLGEGDD